MPDTESLSIDDLHRAYREGATTPRQIMERLLERCAADRHNVWITRLSHGQVMAYVAALEACDPAKLPLYGIPFVIKDNIDLAGIPTTAGCPDYAYVPPTSAFVIQKLLDAGAVPLGKTNLDQFATGLVGTRSPYGACHNSIDSRYISGGSSAGSAVAVAAGLASFSLGTDTAGSGRVPAAFNNIVGLKPSLGRLSTSGVVPACRTLDCISIFALTVADADRVLAVAEGFDPTDAFSRRPANRLLTGQRFGVPRRDQLQFFGDDGYSQLFDETIRSLQRLGYTAVEIDFEPFLAIARLLYDGPWIAERYAAVGTFMKNNPAAVYPVTRRVIAAGEKYSAADAFQAQYRLMQLKRQTEATWLAADFLLTPTAGTIYTREQVEADPIRLNANLGYYTNFMNLIDLIGLAVPAGFRRDGLPFGVTLVGPAHAERALMPIADRLHRAAATPLGASTREFPAVPANANAGRASGVPYEIPSGYVCIAVCGAHMSGLPLNHQLRDRSGFLVEATQTAPHYRLFALPGGPPYRPGLIRVNDGGSTLELEVWAIPMEHAGSFLSGIPAPLGLGKVELTNGTWVTGFICEGHAVDAALEITSFGGWRGYLTALR